MRGSTAAAHLVLTTTLLVCLHLLFRFYDSADARVDMHHTVELSSAAIAVGMGYYALLQILRFVSPRSWGLSRRGPEYAAPHDAEGKDAKPLLTAEPTETVHARLTIENMWCLVYGLGSMFFISFYCITGQQPLPLYCFGVGLVCVSIDYLTDPWLEGEVLPKAWESTSILLAFTGLLLCMCSAVLNNTVDLDPRRMNATWLIGTMICPFISPLIMLVIKHDNGHRVTDMTELCEFAIPFMFILAAIVLFSNSACEHRMSAIFNMTSLDVDLHSLPVITLAPVLAIPALILITTAAIRGHPVDPLLSVCILTSLRQILDNGFDDAVDMFAAGCAVMAVAARIASTVRPPPVDLELENRSFQ